MTNNFGGLLFVALVLISAYLLWRSFRKKPQKDVAIREHTYIKDVHDKQALNEAIKEFRVAYQAAMKNKAANEEERRQLLNDWEILALEEVLRARTVGQLRGASKLAFRGTLAHRLIPLKHEELSAIEVDVAGSDIQKLMLALRRAPKGGEAERVAYGRLERLLSNG